MVGRPTYGVDNRSNRGPLLMEFLKPIDPWSDRVTLDKIVAKGTNNATRLYRNINYYGNPL